MINIYPIFSTKNRALQRFCFHYKLTVLDIMKHISFETQMSNDSYVLLSNRSSINEPLQLFIIKEFE